MTLQNRMTPFGEIIAIPDRGTLMGNCGILHNDNRKIVRNHESRRDWMICALSFKGRQRTLMAPSRYTELFFLDEATALAAGHRPCFTCRRDAFNAFKTAWIAAGLAPSDEKLSVKTVDLIMHRDRMDRGGRKVVYRAAAKELPVNVMIALDSGPGVSWLVREDCLRRWTPGGYTSSRPLPDEIVEVLTPRSSVHVLAAGFVAKLHPSVWIGVEV